MTTSSKSISKNIIRDIAIIAIGILAIWVGLYIVFGMTNPFYVVASGSMVPELEVYDILVVQGNIPFEDLVIGDVIVFDRPSDHNRVIVHRIVSIIDQDPLTIRTKGDANRASIPGTDFPITSNEYIGKVVTVIPQVGYVTQALKPPVNYIIIAIIIGVMISKHFLSKARSKNDVTFSDTLQDDTQENDIKDMTLDKPDDYNINRQSKDSKHALQDSSDKNNKHNDDLEYLTDSLPSINKQKDHKTDTSSTEQKEVKDNHASSEQDDKSKNKDGKHPHSK